MKTTEFDDIDLDVVMQARREKLLNDQKAKQQELEGIEAQLRKIDGYLNPTGAPASKPRATSGPRAKAGDLSVFQRDIIAVVARHQPKGIKAADIYDELGAKDAAGKRRIDVALPKMRESGQLDQPGGRRTPYVLGPNAPKADTPPPVRSGEAAA